MVIVIAIVIVDVLMHSRMTKIKRESKYGVLSKWVRMQGVSDYVLDCSGLYRFQIMYWIVPGYTGFSLCTGLFRVIQVSDYVLDCSGLYRFQFMYWIVPGYTGFSLCTGLFQVMQVSVYVLDCFKLCRFHIMYWIVLGYTGFLA
jgi:hypothetical protein